MNIGKDARDAIQKALGGKVPTDRRIIKLLEEMSVRLQSDAERPLPIPPPGEPDPLEEPTGPDLATARRQVQVYRSRHQPVRFTGLEDAANMLLSVLEPAHQDQVMNVHKDEKWPVWVIMAASIARACDNREINTASHMHPDWLNQTGRTAAPVGVDHCEACGLVIPNARRGQQFCCSAHGSGKQEHSPGCPAFMLSYPREAVEAPSDERPADVPVAETKLPEGMCTMSGCGLMIVNARRGQLRCCNAHGSDKDEHSKDCVTMLAQAKSEASV